MIAISSLPSIWASYKPAQIADSLVETLRGNLNLEFAFVCITGEGEPIESAYSRQGFLTKKALAELKEKLAPWLRPEKLAKAIQEIPSPFGGAPLRISFTPIGHNFKNGILVAGASRPAYPLENERLVLNIAANQTSVTMQHEWAQSRANALLALVEEEREKLARSEQRLMSALKTAEDAQAEAVMANDLKSSFLANMSHEIRTPMGAILGFAEALKTPELSAAQRAAYLDIIFRSGKALTKIIDDILDLSKVEAGKLEIESAPVSMRAICREVILMFAESATGKGIALILDDAGLPESMLHTDPVRVRQVLINLVGNAVKFTSRGEVRVSGTCAVVAGESVRVAIRIADTGPGLSPAAAGRLFQPFVQGDNTSTRKFGGTGLGLALSRKLGQALGGDVTLEAYAPGAGCIFGFTFLAERIGEGAAETGVTAAPEEFGPAVLRGYRILVADDSADNRSLMEFFLSQHGAELFFAEDGLEAVAMAAREPFHLVLMDIQMPKLDGYGALARLRRENFHAPVFALTAHAMKEEMERTAAAGFAAHISKPIDFPGLVRAILAHAVLG